MIKSREEADEILKKYIKEAGIRTFLLKNLARSSEGFSWKMNLPVLSEKIKQIGQPLVHRLSIETETLFLRGGASDYILDVDWEDILSIFPNSRLETIDNAGHWLHAERPQEFFDKVTAFIG